MTKNQVFRTIASIMLCLSLVVPSLGDVLLLPADIKVIGKEAFYGDDSIDEVVLPEGIEVIGERAFANSGLTKINLPSSLTAYSIANNALDPDVHVDVEEGTDAYDWAVENGFLAESPASDFVFSDNGDGSCTLMSYTGAAANVVIPTYDASGRNVLRIGESAFKDNYTIHSVILPATVVEIEEKAFQGCAYLESVTLNDGLQSIRMYAFKDCVSITALHFPDTVSSIAIWAFENCYQLSEINYPVGWMEKPDFGANQYSPFAGCISLTRIMIPEGVTLIPDNAFYGVSSLTEVSLPNSLPEIGCGVFRDCGLVRVDFPKNIYAIKERAFEGCTLLEQVNLNEGLYSIERNAFCGCTALKQIHFPSTVTSIAIWAFDGTGLEEIYYPVNWLSKPDFGVNHDSPFTNCGDLTRIVIPEGVTSIPDYAFMNMGSLQEIILPSSLSQISIGAFKNCYQLAGIRLPYGLQYINEKAFYNTALQRVVIPSTVVSIGEKAFASCAGLSGICIPTSVGWVSNNFADHHTQIYAVPDTALWQSLEEMGYEDSLVEWNGTTDPFAADTAGQFITFMPCDFIAAGQEVTSCTANGDIIPRIQYPLAQGMTLPVPYVTDSGAVKVTVKLRYWNEKYGHYYTYLDANEEIMASSNWDFENDGEGNKTGVLELGLPQHIKTGLYVLQMWSRNEYGFAVDARVMIRIVGDQWTGYVQEDRIHTYPDEFSTEWNGFVDNTDPVTVLEEGINRYKIQMTLSDGGTDIRWVEKTGISETYNPWTGYVMDEWVPTYADPVTAEVNGYVDNMDPVRVIMDENGRYKIVMTLTAGGTATRWVDKNHINKTEYKKDRTFLHIYVDDGEPGQRRKSVYTLNISSMENYDQVVVSEDNKVIRTINGFDAMNNGVYFYTMDLYAPSAKTAFDLQLTGYSAGRPVGKGSFRFYIYDEYPEEERVLTLFLPETSNHNVIYDEPYVESVGRSTPVESEILLIGAYPSRSNPQYYYVSYGDEESHMMRFGFVRTGDARQITGSSEINVLSKRGEHSGLQMCVPFRHTGNHWYRLEEVENAIVTVSAPVPVISVYKRVNDDLLSLVRHEVYDRLREEDGNTLFEFEFALDVAGADAAYCGLYAFLPENGPAEFNYQEIHGVCTLLIEWGTLIEKIDGFRYHDWENDIYTPYEYFVDQSETRRIINDSDVIDGWIVEAQSNIIHSQYLLFIEKNNQAENLRAMLVNGMYFSYATMQNITPWRILIEPVGQDYELTVSLKSTERLPVLPQGQTEALFRIVYRWTNAEGAMQYGMLRKFSYSSSGFSGYKVKLIADENMNITYNTTYEFLVFLSTGNETPEEFMGAITNTYGYTYSYMFENGEIYDDTKYYEMLNQYMLAGDNPLDDEKLSEYIVRRMGRFAVQTSDAQVFVETLSRAPALYRNLYLVSIADYDLGNLYTNKQPDEAGAYYDNWTNTITIQNYLYNSNSGPALTTTFFHESGHAIDRQAGNYQPGTDDTLYNNLVSDLKRILNAQLAGMGYSSEDRKILLNFLIGPKNTDNDVKAVIKEINAERAENGVTKQMTLTDYDELREALYNYFRDLGDHGAAYTNALMVTDISNGLMNEKIYTVHQSKYVYLDGHFPSKEKNGETITLKPEEADYWYGWFGKHTDKMCREAWAEWYAAQIIGNTSIIRANEDTYPLSTGYMHQCAFNMLKYYIHKHWEIDYNRIIVTESTGGYSFY